jgi:hypothetical protein
MTLFLALVAWIVFQIWGWDVFGLPALDVWESFWLNVAVSFALLAIFREH